MSKIHINRDFVESSLLRYVDGLLVLPEIGGVRLCDVVILKMPILSDPQDRRRP